MQKILIIQLTRMGDCIQTLPLLKSMKRQRPESHISVLCVKEFSGIFARSRFLDRLVSVEAAYILRLRNQGDVDPLRDIPELGEQYDFVINLTHNWVGGVFCSLASGKRKAGRINTQYPEGQVKTDWAKYLFASQKGRTENLFNIVDMHSAMAGLVPQPVSEYIEIDSDERRRAAELLRTCGWKNKGRLIAFQPGANQLHRAWPAECFASLASRLLIHPDVEIVLLGSQSEKELIRGITARIPHPVIDLAGETRISEIPGVLSLCSMLVSNDTGNIHMAAASGTTSIGLFFSTAYFAETAPYGEGHVVLQAELPCSPCNVDEKCDMPACRDVITVPAVESVALHLLGHSKGDDFDFPGITAYRSRFVSNGLLLYSPVQQRPISEHFATGLLHRFLWERAMGIASPQSDSIENELLLAPQDVLRTQIDQTAARLARYESWYSRGRGLLARAESDLRLPSPVLERARATTQAIRGIETAVLSSEDSILKYFHLLHMADTDCATYPALVHGAADSYSRLSALVGCFMHHLSTLRNKLPEGGIQ